ncbi:YjfK family protein [Marinicellulosiphila megalodicopiae]|uniref:YjfK family protein n=1 Tax=Marinicellulosiphila megalodicopiae TaxID=2724896 RepID=UPI003BB04BA9
MSFFKKLFRIEKEDTRGLFPHIMGLRLEASFEIDALHLKLLEPHLTINQCTPTQIIQAVGYVKLDGNHIFRFYTDDEGFLQVVSEGGTAEQHVIDVKMFHYFDTLNIENQSDWDELLFKKMGNASYELNGHTYNRVWTSTSDYHKPVAMQEKTYDATSVDANDFDQTDQFTMLYERELETGDFEALYLSAEEKINKHNQYERCLVISTGMSLSPTQIKIHG